MNNRPSRMIAASRLPALLSLVLLLPACRVGAQEQPAGAAQETNAMTRRIEKTDDAWRSALTAEQYRVLRQKATEAPFSGAYDNFYREGVYACAGCGALLFRSGDKFDAGCGWPSFTAPADSAGVEEAVDRSHGMLRTEVLCRNCGGHLGHVFEDGPAPTGLRYCINSAALDFRPAEPTR
jgi:peptide-methionine (R)-S-oxide reductase